MIILTTAILGAAIGGAVGALHKKPGAPKSDMLFFAALGASVGAAVTYWKLRGPGASGPRVGFQGSIEKVPGRAIGSAFWTPEEEADSSFPNSFASFMRNIHERAERGTSGTPWHDPSWWYREGPGNFRHSPLPNTADAFANWFVESIDSGLTLPRRTKAPLISPEHWEAIDQALKRNGERAAQSFLSRCRQIGRSLSKEEHLRVEWTTGPGHGFFMNPQVMPDGTVVDGGCPSITTGEFGDFEVVGHLRSS